MNEAIQNTQPSAASGDSGDDPAQGVTRIFKGKLFRVREGHGWGFTEEPPPPPPAQVLRPARVAQVLAMAHRLQAAINRGDYRDRADLARQLGFTRARITQLLDLILLAPDIQEQVLALEAVDGREPFSERVLREVLRAMEWKEQRRLWIAVGQVVRAPPTHRLTI